MYIIGTQLVHVVKNIYHIIICAIFIIIFTLKKHAKKKKFCSILPFLGKKKGESKIGIGMAIRAGSMCVSYCLQQPQVKNFPLKVCFARAKKKLG